MARNDFFGTLNSATFSVLLTASTADTMVMSISAINIDGTNSVDVTVDTTDASDSNTAKEVANLVPVAGGDTADIISKPLLMKTGDTLRAKASANGDAVLRGWYETYTAT